MNKLFIVLVVTIALFSACGAEKTNEKASVTSEGEVALSPSAYDHLQAMLDEFIACREKSTDRMDCRFWISKLIGDFHDINDFEKEGDQYVIFDSIRPIIEKSDKWIRLGEANTQEILDEAQDNANNGQATLAIDVSAAYGLVVLIIPGELEKAGKWNLKVPNSACFTHVKSLTPFFDKSLAYAFGTSKDIVLYSRKE